MDLSRDARVVCGITLITVPSIMYGGLTLLGLLTNGVAGMAPEGLTLTETQWALFRAGHAHAGVWLILSLVVAVPFSATPTAPGGGNGGCPLFRAAGKIEADGGSSGHVPEHQDTRQFPTACDR